jgi:thiol:disulfide interchange protein DsbD
MKSSVFRYLLIGFLTLLSSVIQAVSLLPIDDALSVEAKMVDAETVKLHWRVAEGYFLFRSKQQTRSNTIEVQIANEVLPKGRILQDSFFGDLPILEGDFDSVLHLSNGAKSATTLELKLSYKGCKDIENCYPHREKIIRIDLPEPSVATQAENDTPSAPEITRIAYIDDNEFLDPEVAFTLKTRMDKPNQLQITWHIVKGYYLYKDKMGFELSNTAAHLGDIQWPEAVTISDPYFGDVLVYKQDVEIVVPLQNTQGMTAVMLKSTYQGCADEGLCYPPLEREDIIELAAASIPVEVEAEADDDIGLRLANLGKGGFNADKTALSDTLSTGTDDEFIDPDLAFRLSGDWSQTDRVQMIWQITDGYYLYRHSLKFTLADGRIISNADIPQGTVKQDPHFGEVETYHHQLVVDVPLAAAEQGKPLSIEVEYQGCADAGLCYPPMQKTIELTPPVGGSISTSSEMAVVPDNSQLLSEQDQIADFLNNNSLFWIILSFFGFGLLLSLTPCVFPMIPILSGIIVGQGKDITTAKAFSISLTYVLAMAMTYTLVGLVAGLLGANVQAALQVPWVLWSFFFVFVLLSLSMFGFYNLQLPSSWQSKLNDLSNRQSGGTLIGAGIMGFLSALIVGPCVAAPLAGALIYISQTHDALLGALALFSLSMGMGVPLLIIGTSAGQFLPKAGMWMEKVKYVFGVMLLAVGVWMLERILPVPVIMVMYAALLIGSAIYMGALDSLHDCANGWRKLWKGFGLFLLIYGAALFIGALSGGNSYLQPLRGIAASNTTSDMAHEITASKHALPFKMIKGEAGLQAALDAAKGKKVMLDFYADWCVSCKEMDALTFSNAKVQAALKDTIVLQADVTDNDDLDKALMKRFSIFGPPAILFFNEEGQEQKHLRLVGFEAADSFLLHLEKR